MATIDLAFQIRRLIRHSIENGDSIIKIRRDQLGIAEHELMLQIKEGNIEAFYYSQEDSTRGYKAYKIKYPSKVPR